MLDPSFLRRAVPAGALAIELAVITTGSVVAGYWLDGRFGTEPWLTLLFTGLGFAGGMFVLIRGLKRLQGPDEEHPPDSP